MRLGEQSRVSSISRDSLVFQDTRRRNRLLAGVSLIFGVVCLVLLDRIGWPRFLLGGVFLLAAAWLWTSYQRRCIHKGEGSVVQIDSKLGIVTDESAPLAEFHMIRVREHDIVEYRGQSYHGARSIPELLVDVALTDHDTGHGYGGPVPGKAYSVSLVGNDGSFEIGVADSPITANKRAEAFGDWLDKRVVPFKKQH